MAKSPIDILLDKVEYKDVEISNEAKESNLPYVIKSGTLNLGGLELDVIILNDGRRLFTEESLMKFFGDF